MEKPCSWRIVGQSLCQMINNKKHRQRKRRRDGWWCNRWFENKRELSFLLKAEEDSDSLSAWRRAFQSLGADLRKALKPNGFLLWFSSTLGMRRWDREDGRRDRGGSWRGISSWRSCGAEWFTSLYVWRKIGGKYEVGWSGKAEMSTTEFLAVGEARKAILWPIPGLQG